MFPALAAALCSFSATAQEGEDVIIDRVVALVESDAVMVSELDIRYAMILERLDEDQRSHLPAENILRRQILDRLVVERLQLEVAERRGIRIDDLTLNDMMREMAGKNGMNLTQFRDALAAEGIQYSTFRNQLRDELTIEKLRNRIIGGRVKVTDQEVDEFLAGQQTQLNSEVEYQVLHILITVPEAATPNEVAEARKQATDIRQRALDGEDFTRLAIQESDGQNALEGGDLGWRRTTELPDLFARPLTGMSTGDVAEVLRSPSGFHIIKLEDKRGDSGGSIQQTHARHILIKPSAVVDDDDAQQTLQGLRNRIVNGDDFAEVAKGNSDDTASAVEGGDLGWQNPGALVAEFEEVMNGLPIGEVSEPFKTEFGWHIVEVLERRDSDNSQDALRTRAREILFQRKAEEETELWIRRLKDESYVEYVEPT
ncbi:MAG: peptidylprolyl isomerase [Pseudomonadota bacterium]|nr:peptidylprolyl isomerase [Pseudomonadota bacterium]